MKKRENAGGEGNIPTKAHLARDILFPAPLDGVRRNRPLLLGRRDRLIVFAADLRSAALPFLASTAFAAVGSPASLAGAADSEEGSCGVGPGAADHCCSVATGSVGTGGGGWKARAPLYWKWNRRASSPHSSRYRGLATFLKPRYPWCGLLSSLLPSPQKPMCQAGCHDSPR